MTGKQLSNFQEWAGDGKTMGSHFEAKRPDSWIRVGDIARRSYSKMFGSKVEKYSAIDDLLSCTAFYGAISALGALARILGNGSTASGIMCAIDEAEKMELPIAPEEFAALCKAQENPANLS